MECWLLDQTHLSAIHTIRILRVSKCWNIVYRVRMEVCQALRRQLQPARHYRRPRPSHIRPWRRSTLRCSRGTRRPDDADSTYCWRSVSRTPPTTSSSSWTDAAWSSRQRTSTSTRDARQRLRCSATLTWRKTSTSLAYVLCCRLADNLPSPRTLRDTRRLSRNVTSPSLECLDHLEWTKARQSFFGREKNDFKQIVCLTALITF